MTVFSNPKCHRCDATTRQMTNLGIAHDLVMLVDNPNEAERLRATGRTDLPVVEVRYPDGSSASWTGYRPDRIKELAA